MNRIFHARIVWYQYFLLVVLGINAFGALWSKHIVIAVLMMLLLVVVIEQIIHTQYTFTAEETLELSYGRFLRKKVIRVAEITSVSLRTSMKWGRFSVTRYILVEYGGEKFATFMPVKEQEFLDLLEKRRNACA